MLDLTSPDWDARARGAENSAPYLLTGGIHRRTVFRMPTEPNAQAAAPSAAEKIDWPTPELAAVGIAAAITTGELLASERSWVRRRVEEFSFLDGVRVSREMSVDFYLPPSLADTDVVFVPLGLPRKVELRDLNVRDEAGRSLPVLTRTENATISAAMLLIQAEEILREQRRDEPLETDLVKDLRQVAGDLIAARWSRTEPMSTSRSALRRIRHAPDDVSKLSAEQRSALWNDTNMRGYLQLLSERFLLLVRLEASPRSRRVLKVSYEETADRAEEQPVKGRVLPDSWRISKAIRKSRLYTIASNRRRGWREGIAIEPFNAVFPTRALYGAASYHVEMAVDDDLIICFAELGRWVDEVNLATGETTRKDPVDLRQERAKHRAHLYVPGVVVGDGVGLSRSGFEIAELGYFRVSISLRPGVVLGPAMIAAATTSMLFVGAIIRAAGVAVDHDITLILLAIPALFAAYLVPTSRQGLVRRLYGLLRLSVLASAVIALAAAVGVALKLTGTQVVVWWLVLGVLSLAVSGPLASALLRTLDRARSA
jgi:hypothetical protein